MKNVILSLILFTTFSSITSCANINTKKIEHSDGVQWDFDHQVQFIQTTLAEHYYQLEMIPNSRVGFGQLSAFLLRRSYDLCGSYHYKIEMMKGIENIDDKRFTPNYISPSLMANVECNLK